jgi:hypothetical protein
MPCSPRKSAAPRPCKNKTVLELSRHHTPSRLTSSGRRRPCGLALLLLPPLPQTPSLLLWLLPLLLWLPWPLLLPSGPASVCWSCVRMETQHHSSMGSNQSQYFSHCRSAVEPLDSKACGRSCYLTASSSCSQTAFLLEGASVSAPRANPPTHLRASESSSCASSCASCVCRASWSVRRRPYLC